MSECSGYYDRIGSGGGYSGEHLAYKHNYIDLDPTYTDKWGDPLVQAKLKSIFQIQGETVMPSDVNM